MSTVRCFFSSEWLLEVKVGKPAPYDSLRVGRMPRFFCEQSV
jgi:hypothetical protein